MSTVSQQDIRRRYVWGRLEEFLSDGGVGAPMNKFWDEFDAWLNADRARIWGQGRLAAKWDTPNPYRVADQVRDDMKEGK